MSARCWICLDTDDAVERNPPPCTCVDGGWVHAVCLREYAQKAASGRVVRTQLSFFRSRATVYMPHAPCGAIMPVLTVALRSHTNLVAYALGGTVVQLFSVLPTLVLPLLIALSACIHLMARVAPPLALLAFVAAVVTPLTRYEADNRWTLYAAGGVVLVLAGPSAAAVLVVAAAIAMRNLFYANLTPWVTWHLLAAQ